MEYVTCKDNDLLLLLSMSDEKAFSELYNRYWKRMLVRALARLGNQEDAEEVVNDTFADLWKSRKNLRIRHSLPTYLAAVVKYKIMARVVADDRRIKSVGEVNDLQVADDATQQQLSFRELQISIEMAVKALPDKCQLVFRLSREEGLSDRQIAHRLNLSQKTVEGHISSALKKLRTSLGHFIGLLSLLGLLLVFL